MPSGGAVSELAVPVDEDAGRVSLKVIPSADTW